MKNSWKSIRSSFSPSTCCVHDLTGEIVARVRKLLLIHAGCVGEHFHTRGDLCAFGQRLGRGMENFGEPVEFATVLQRYPGQLGDHIGRQLAGDVADEITLEIPAARTAARDDRIDDAGGELADSRAQLRPRALW